MAGYQEKLVDLEYVTLKHETDKAYLLQIGDKEVWLPKSQCEVDKGDKTVTMPEWLAVEKELV